MVEYEKNFDHEEVRYMMRIAYVVFSVVVVLSLVIAYVVATKMVIIS